MTIKSILPPFTRLRTQVVPALLGDDISARVDEVLDLLELSQYAVYLIGPSGSGKTHAMKKIAAIWAQRHGVPAYYLQLSPETTKTTIIMGHRIIDGSYIPVDGVVATGMREGAIICIDEATHTLPGNLLDFNSIIERDGMVAIGDMTAERSSTTRFLFSSNDDSHVGNIRLPQSFAQRMLPVTFDYPSFETEVAVALDIVRRELDPVRLLVPDVLARFLASYVREMRRPEYPLSARNIAQALLRLHRDRWRLARPYDTTYLDPYFLTNPDALTKRIVERVFPGTPVKNMSQLVSGSVVELKVFVSHIGISRFRDLVWMSCMLPLPVDGMGVGATKHRQDMQQGLL